MKVTIDYANKTISVIRAALAGNSLDPATGATEVVYSYTDINDATTYTKVSGSQALTINIKADGTPDTIIWGSGTYSGWELQA